MSIASPERLAQIKAGLDHYGQPERGQTNQRFNQMYGGMFNQPQQKQGGGGIFGGIKSALGFGPSQPKPQIGPSPIGARMNQGGIGPSINMPKPMWNNGQATDQGGWGQNNKMPPMMGGVGPSIGAIPGLMGDMQMHQQPPNNMPPQGPPPMFNRGMPGMFNRGYMM